MLQIRKVSVLAGAVIAGFALPNVLHAAVTALDSASNPPYAPSTADTSATELNGLNGGSGFGPWVVTDVETGPGPNTSPSGNGGSFDNSANNVANDGANVRNPAPVFDVYDNGNPSGTLGSSVETATRPFLTPMSAGGTFSFVETLHNLNGAGDGIAGFQLLDSLGNVLLDLHIAGGAAGYAETDANQTNLLLFSTDAAHSGSSSRVLDYNFEDSDTISIAIDPAGDFTITTGGHRGSTYADGGEINMSTGGPAAFAIYDNDGGNGSDVSVNNLSETATAVPEPASIVLGGFGMFTLLLSRRPKSRLL
jgi:hypothetical protein